jgi:preprotein translocase subunit SecF
MEFFKSNLNINFMSERKRKIALAISALLILLTIVSLFVRGLNFGVDFTGGTMVEVHYSQPVELEKVREAMKAGGISEAIVTHFGTSKDVLIRLPSNESQDKSSLSNLVLSSLQGSGDVELQRVEFVGPQVGDELRDDGGLAMIYTLIGILIYVALRFEFRFSVGAIIATIHDVVLTIGFFSITQFEFDLTVLAAILAVIGYSLNDTIVVFDRVRENFHTMRKTSVVDIINASMNQTLSRTIMTSGTTLLVVLALLIFGGKVLFGFSIALFFGIIVGTYSSIYIASVMLILLKVSKSDLMPADNSKANEDGSQV